MTDEQHDPKPTGPSAKGGDERTTVAMSGSSGLVGAALTAALEDAGRRVIRLVRRDPRGPSERRWDPESPGPGLLDGVDAVVHLAGATIAGRFTSAHKRAVRESRVRPTELLARAAALAQPRPHAFVAASAIGFYGPRRAGELTETSEPGAGFLADTVVAWEAATAPAAAAGIRVVNVRTGVAQSARGGPLSIYAPLFRLGLGGRFGDGRQVLSWIDLEDLVRVYLRAIHDERVTGPVNAVAPTPVTNSEYTRTLASVLGRPAPFVVPRFATRLALTTEGSLELVEADQRVVPTKLQAMGFSFLFPTLEASLRQQLGR